MDDLEKMKSGTYSYEPNASSFPQGKAGDDLRKSARTFYDWQPRAGERFYCVWAGIGDPFTPGQTYAAEQLGDTVVLFDDDGAAWRGIGYAGFVPEALATIARQQVMLDRALEDNGGLMIENARLEAALRDIAGMRDYQLPKAQDRARAALSPVAPDQGEG